MTNGYCDECILDKTRERKRQSIKLIGDKWLCKSHDLFTTGVYAAVI